MSEIVFSHVTALKILRTFPELAERPRTTLPATFASSNHRAADAAAIIGDLLRGQSETDAPIFTLAGSGWNRYSPQGISTHSGSELFPTRSFIEISNGVFLTCPELAIAQIAAETSALEALILGFECCGSFATSRTSYLPNAQTRPITNTRLLKTYHGKHSHLRSVGKLLRNATFSHLRDGSASPQETRLALLLGLPLRLGGRGLGMPSMNHPIKADARARAIASCRSFRGDLCWPSHRIDVEYASRLHHADPESRIRDSRRQHALEHMGWTVIQVSEADIASRTTIESIACTVRRKLGKRNPQEPPHYPLRVSQLERAILNFYRTEPGRRLR